MGKENQSAEVRGKTNFSWEALGHLGFILISCITSINFHKRRKYTSHTVQTLLNLKLHIKNGGEYAR